MGSTKAKRRKAPKPRPVSVEPTPEKIRLSPAAGKALFEMDDFDRAILQIRMRDPLLPLAGIAKALDVDYGAVHRRMRRPGFQEAYRELTLCFGDLMEKAANEAVRTLRGIMKNDSLKTEHRIRAAEAILNMKGGILKSDPRGNHSDMPTRVFRTTITPEGALIQEVMDLELGAKIPERKVINVSPISVADAVADADDISRSE